MFRQIAEQALPYFCTTVSDNHTLLNKVHHLVFLLASKVKDVFFGSVIKSCLDQNWSLKGLRQVLKALFKILTITDYKDLLNAINTHLKA